MINNMEKRVIICDICSTNEAVIDYQFKTDDVTEQLNICRDCLMTLKQESEQQYRDYKKLDTTQGYVKRRRK